MEHEGSLPYSQQLVSCFYQRNSFHASLSLYFFKVHLGLQFLLSLLPVSFLQVYPPKLCMFLLLNACYTSRPSHPLRYHHPNEIWEASITELLDVSFSPVSCHVSQLRSTNLSAASVLPPLSWGSTFHSHTEVQLQAKLQLRTFSDCLFR